MTNYQNSKIYKIVDNLTNAIYIGSTCKSLEQRLNQHIANNKSFKAGVYPNYVTVFKILDNNDYKIELIENYPCATKQDLNIREGKIITQFRNNKLNIVNRNVAGQTNKQSCAQYRLKNRLLINAKQNQKHNCCCGGKYTCANKSIHEKSKKHQTYINKSTTVNIKTLNINITLNKIEDLENILNVIK